MTPPNGPHVAFEDDVLVTETGHEWWSRSIPLESPRKDTLPDEPATILEAVLDPYQRSHVVAETGVVQLE